MCLLLGGIGDSEANLLGLIKPSLAGRRNGGATPTNSSSSHNHPEVSPQTWRGTSPGVVWDLTASGTSRAPIRSTGLEGRLQHDPKSPRQPRFSANTRKSRSSPGSSSKSPMGQEANLYPAFSLKWENYTIKCFLIWGLESCWNYMTNFLSMVRCSFFFLRKVPYHSSDPQWGPNIH